MIKILDNLIYAYKFYRATFDNQKMIDFVYPDFDGEIQYMVGTKYYCLTLPL